MARLAAVGLLCLLAALGAGCNGARETDQVAYIISIGIDVAPGGEYNITYRLAKPSFLGGDTGKGGGGDSSELITITAPSLAIARELLGTTVARFPNLSHTKAVFIGEGLARKGVADALGPLIRFREFRGSMFIIVVHGATAEEFMHSNKPVLEKLVSRWIDGMGQTYSEGGFHGRTFLHDFYLRLKEGSGSPYAALAAVNPLDGKGGPVAGKKEGEKSGEYLGDSVPRRGGNKASMTGLAIFCQDKMVGMLTSEETRMLDILNGEFTRGFVTIADPLEPQKGINVLLRLDRKPIIKVELTETGAQIDIDVRLEGEITSISSGINYETAEYRQLLERQISQIIERDMAKTIRYCQEKRSDVADFGKFIRPRFNNYNDYRRFNWDERYRQAEVTVKAGTKLRRSGLLWKTSPLRGRE